MNDKYFYIRKCLHNEFEYLNRGYPLGNKFKNELHVMPEDEESGGINGFAFYNLKKEGFSADVFLIIDTELRFDDNDKKIMKKNNIEEKGHLLFWLLYHELGHIFDLRKSKNKMGIKKVKKRMNIYIKKTEKIRKMVKQGIIENEYGEEIYRKIREEIVADSFANKIYRIRKKEIEKYIEEFKRIEEGEIK